MPARARLVRAGSAVRLIRLLWLIRLLLRLIGYFIGSFGLRRFPRP